jgi:hypothetical protein
MKRLLILLIVLLTVFFSNTVVAQNTIHVPAQYLTIQEGINAASNGDTVLVADGLYYENINFLGKAITVASHYLVDGDTTHIENTIINGSQPTNPDSGSVVYFVSGEDTNSVLCGFTITGGSGTNWYLDMWLREGGGIFCLSSGARIVKNYITRNRIDGTTGDGGGVWVVNMTSSLPYLILEQNRITENFIRGNTVGVEIFVTGGGAVVWGTSARIVGNLFERDTAAASYGAVGGGLAFQGFPDGPYPIGVIQGNIFRGNVVTTLQRGAFGGGLVVEHTGPVWIMDNVFEGNVAVSSDYWARGGGLWIGDRYLPSNITPGRKFIFRNRFLGNRTICTGWGTGGGIELDATTATIAQNEILENTATGTVYGGGGIWVYASSFRIENNLIARNSAIPGGGGVQISSPPMSLRGTDQIIANNTVFDNDATSGGGLSIISGANVVSFNNVLWADTAQNGKEINVVSAVANINYCDVEGGYSGTGNISYPPLLLDSTLRLSDYSPCIGAGRDSLEIGGVWYRAPSLCLYGGPRPDPAGSYPDIGACENSRSTPLTVVDDQPSPVPSCFTLEQNFPNPFNPTTTIRYALPHPSFVTLTVYNMLGQQVAQLVNEQRRAGYYDVVFRGDGLASGVYFYRLDAGGFASVMKLFLLK